MAKKAKKAEKAAIALQGAIPKLSLNLPLDASKTKAIQRCIAKGTLTITVNKVDLGAGKIGEAYIYD